MAISQLKALLDTDSITRDEILTELMTRVDVSGRINVDFSQCWRWKMSHSSAGYGQLMVRGIPLNAHRLSWWLHNGCPHMERTEIIGHKCDNKTCCNPEHLENIPQGTNVKDAYVRGLTVQTKTRFGDGRHMACTECRAHTHNKCVYDDDEDCTRCKSLGLTCVKEAPALPATAFVAGASSGESNKHCKVKDADIIAMRAERAAGAKVKDIATKYGITAAYASSLINGKTARSITE